jgi:hypothetical protein
VTEPYNFNDLIIPAQNYGALGRDFSTGDFTYDEAVGFADLVLLAQRYGSGLPSAPTAAQATVDARATPMAVFNLATRPKARSPRTDAPQLNCQQDSQTPDILTGRHDSLM